MIIARDRIGTLSDVVPYVAVVNDMIVSEKPDQVTAVVEGRVPDHLLNPDVLKHQKVKGFLKK